ncbi:hypothetical protein PNA2_0010 [Pyrococcus sp. NA2]|uniref:hypothetical protein n=1 Tax=Pyrococcus sp. (strain NA2) TaxID=342949 RepID=UPI000209AC91|nr:hypothetical protein [Pyrococcus sp. NA2]AEC50928.1 hypothetical protein PNA2_0010 [Pyrococcus sp. NA2]
MEIWVSDDEFELIKKNKDEVLKILREREASEKLLLSLYYQFLRRKLAELQDNLKRIEKEYTELLEFERRAIKDKETLKKVRLELSKENSKLREGLKNESVFQKN